MVLQDVENTSPDSFSDRPPSENDSYSSPPTSYGSSRNYDTSDLEKPLPILGPILGISQGLVKFKADQTIKYAEQKVGRSLRPEEAHALASHIFKMEQTRSYYAAVGAGLGIYRAYGTMASNRYPFYLPKPEDVNPNKFMFVKGPMAQYARQSWRFFLYVAVASNVGKVLGQLGAQRKAALDTSNDPKLADFTRDLKASMEGQQKRWQEQREAGFQGRRPTQEDTSQGLPPHAGAPRPWGPPRRPASAPSPAPSEDNMSPTSGNETWGSGSDFSYGDTPPQQEQRSDWETPRQQPQPQSAAWASRSTQSDDDASPTGGLFQDEVQSQSRPGESAWDRLRRGAGPPPGQRPPQRVAPPHREQREGSGLGDSFTFAGTEEDRKLAQEQAQKEFDARIERERQGRDFNDQQRRW